MIWTWLCGSWLKNVKSNTNGGSKRTGSSSTRTESRGVCTLNGVWLLGAFSTVGLENNVLTLFCSAQSCRSYYTFKSPGGITLGSYDSGGGAGAPQAPNRLGRFSPRSTSVCQSAPRQDADPPLGMHQPVHLSISRQSYKATNTKRALEGHHKSNASTFALKLQFDIEIS